MKKQGPPPCGMYNVGNFLAVFTDTISRLVQPSRADRERQLRKPAPYRLTLNRQARALTLAPSEFETWAALLAAVAVIPVAAAAADAAAVAADAALVGAVSEIPIICCSESSRLLNRPWFVAGA